MRQADRLIAATLRPPHAQSLSPRQTRLLARARERGEGGGGGEAADVVCNSGGPGTLLEIDAPYLYNSKEQRRREKERADT